jgi:tRNA (guanine37-N1)-methyltransferase
MKSQRKTSKPVKSQNKTILRIDIITAFPDMFTSVLQASILKIAQEKKIVEIFLHNIHDYAEDKFRHIDDSPFGGGSGMIIQCQPVFKCIEKLKSERSYDEIIYMSADGERLNQKTANQLSLNGNIIILCGHYKGVDQRIRDTLIKREISIGDYVLSGGELPAMVLIDSVIRLLPGVLGDAASALEDSYQDGLLEPPYYTRPAEFRGMLVPEILLSGDPKKIDSWRKEQSIEKTKIRRPDLFSEFECDE